MCIFQYLDGAHVAPRAPGFRGLEMELSHYATAAEALEAYVVPGNPMPGHSEQHDKLYAELMDVVTIQVRMIDTGELRYMARPRKALEIYSVGTAWIEDKKNGRGFIVTAGAEQ